ncbi:hypothetical protein G9U51_05540 [Calidifontibacter sp. DB0510]|uniref:Uncharacterized protein n=1 Tax=Metallococcus carri TaxID=1656884 RepID=A0A967EGL8_9MICO|nr:hypothetical protein [Metallococcus carri]NHN55248.1 hypothetical protein [Metallococcus carri]NOP36325.1 hypothetical protein [Calidifontibacter sp. DB2511S]
MSRWWSLYVVDAGKLPLAVCFASFVLTFLGTRAVTRLIRSGRGPFRNQALPDGTRVHHAVPGIVLLLAGAITALASSHLVPLIIAGVLVGSGGSLVLDEFALILHLDDVYWAHEGRASVQAVALTCMCFALLLLGYTPASVEALTDRDAAVRYVVLTVVLLTIVFCIVCAMKGKYRLVLLAVFLPIVAIVGACRLARPGSPWFRR